MSQNFLSGPEGANRGDRGASSTTGSKTGHDSGNGNQRRHEGSPAASPDQCLRGLTQLPGLVAMGILTPGQANCMRAVFATILQHYQRSQAAPIQARATADIVQAVRDKPELAAMLESLLTDEQLETLMKEARDVEDDRDG
jgi:hypothetical protein